MHDDTPVHYNIITQEFSPTTPATHGDCSLIAFSLSGLKKPGFIPIGSSKSLI